MQFLQKHGSVVMLQICNSMQYSAKYSKRMPLQQEAQLLLGDRATQKHAKDCRMDVEMTT